MRFGIAVPNIGDFGDPGLLVGLAQATEAAGWDGFFVWDHVARPERCRVVDPWIVLGAIAATTTRIRFGPMVSAPARRRVTKLARETVTLDHLSNGRFILGVGLGHFDQEEFSAFGDEGDRRIRGRILDESLDVLAGLWTGRPFGFKGEHLSLAESTFLPAPRQRPRIPVWVAGLWPNRRPMRRAAAWDGAYPIDRDGDLSKMLSLSDMAAAIAFVEAARTSRAAYDHVHAGISTGRRDRDIETVERYAAVGVTWWLEHCYPGRFSIDDVRGLIREGPPRDQRRTASPDRPRCGP